MNTTTRLATFGVALVALVVVGAGLGAAIGPDVAQPVAEAPAPTGQGVVAAADGYRLIPASTTLDGDPGDAVELGDLGGHGTFAVAAGHARDGELLGDGGGHGCSFGGVGD